MTEAGAPPGNTAENCSTAAPCAFNALHPVQFVSRRETPGEMERMDWEAVFEGPADTPQPARSSAAMAAVEAPAALTTARTPIPARRGPRAATEMEFENGKV